MRFEDNNAVAHALAVQVAHGRNLPEGNRVISEGKLALVVEVQTDALSFYFSCVLKIMNSYGGQLKTERSA
jgi:hypothetical protein